MRSILILITPLILLSSCQRSYSTDKVIRDKESLRKSIFIRSQQPLDLEDCIVDHQYPPHFPLEFYWRRPDTTNWPKDQKQSLMAKYQFDSLGRVSAYFYQGSGFSAIFPRKYEFSYHQQFSHQITRVSDQSKGQAYQISYAEEALKMIELVDSNRKVIEAFTVVRDL